MTGSHRLELLMQRAVDGELTPTQRHELLECVADQPEGWKFLACAFLEEQLVAGGVRRSAAAEPMQTEDDVVQPLKTPKGFWYRHPVISTAVTLCLSFVLGLSVPWGRVLPSAPIQTTPIASTPRRTETIPVDTTGPDRSRLVSPEESLLRAMEQLRHDLEDLRNDGFK